MLIHMEKCRTCLVEKPPEDFPATKRKPRGVPRLCTKCKKASAVRASMLFNKKHPDRHRGCYMRRRLKNWDHVRDIELRSVYGVPLGWYAKTFSEQNGCCKICRLPREIAEPKRTRFCVDHDATTGVIRGLLCTDCNISIGRLKHDISRLKAAIEYLAAFQE